MNKFTAVLPAKIRTRWDRVAHEQLCEHAALLVAEHEVLIGDLHRAEDDAEYWRESFMRSENPDQQFALTQDGQIYRVAACS